MADIFYVEFVKLKRLHLWILILVCAFIPSFISTIGYLTQDRQPIAYWSEIMFDIGNYSALFAPAVFAIMIGYNIVREYEQHMVDFVLTYPHSRYKFILCKILYMLPVILLTSALTIICALISGYILLGSMPTLYLLTTMVKINFWVSLAQFALIPMAAAVCLIGRSYTVASSYSVSLLIGTSMLTKAKANYVIPWVAPWLIGRKLGYHPIDVIQYQYSFACILLCLVFAGSLVFSVLYFQNASINKV